MSDSTKPPSTLSEISHLFLSSLRDKHAGPKRTPPTSRPAPSIDLSPEELDKVSDVDGPTDSAPVTALLVSHLDDSHPAIAAYAQYLAAHNQRVGLIEVDSDDLRLSCLSGSSSEEQTAETASYFEPRHLAEAMEELNADVDRWLLLVKNPKLPEAQSVLRRISHWVLVSTCDSDGIVAAYRALKSVSPLARPRLTIALLDAANAEQAEHVYHKISGVCEQFLHWPIERGPSLRSGVEPNIHTIMHWNPQHSSSESAPHWQVIETFLSRSRALETDISPEEHQEISMPVAIALPKAPLRPAQPPSEKSPEGVAVLGSVEFNRAAPGEQSRTACGEQSRTAAGSSFQNSTPILSLNATTPTCVLDAVLQNNQDLIPCPVPLPMCETGRLTVGRDRRLLLLAVAGKGLFDLRSISYAYRWLMENRQLVAMAVPQMAIDATALPKLRLMVDRADRDGQMLMPLLQNPLVEMQPFRTLNWSGRLGLMLEAA